MYSVTSSRTHSITGSIAQNIHLEPINDAQSARNKKGKKIAIVLALIGIFLSITLSILIANYSSKSEMKPIEKCNFPPAWIGDGICDDAINTEVCGFDGGDCWRIPDFTLVTRTYVSLVTTTTQFTANTNVPLSTTTTTEPYYNFSQGFFDYSDCMYTNWTTDHWCDSKDTSNNPQCNYDGG